MGFSFKVTKKDKSTEARAGVITTKHGKIMTPAFIPVGTLGAVKTLSPDELGRLGAEVVLANTYHLYLRPGEKIIEKLGGLHQFMGWLGPIITDSGGFQVFSLGFALEHGVGKIANIFPKEEGVIGIKRKKGRSLVKIDEDGVTFRSHLDGKKLKFTPLKSIRIQEALGADIILAFDECTSPLSDYGYTKKALERTHRWAKICLKVKKRKDQALFGIIQGGEYQDLRVKSAWFISNLDFQGFAIGGSLGKSKKDMHRVLEWTVPILSPGRPRHLLGIGQPDDLFECVERGIDLFDCVTYTRLARNGTLVTRAERLNILQQKFASDKKPIEKDCSCYTCQHFSRAYLRHLLKVGEIFGHRLATIHNLHFVLSLMRDIRKSILDGSFLNFKKKFLKNFNK